MTSTNFKRVRLFKLVRELNVSLETLKEHLEQNGYADALTGSGINAAIQDEAAYNELVSAFADNMETAGRVHKKRARQTASEATPVPPAEPAPEAAVATGDETEPLPETILKIGVGHLFATGNRPDRDEIFHIAGMRYSEKSAPEEKDWMLNPGRLIRKETDKGLFVVLDQRIRSNENMCNMQSALPVKLHPRSTEPDQMDWFINEGLTHLGLKAEFESREIDLRKIRLPD